MSSICFLGSKSFSHVLSCIERCKERLLAIGPISESARRQIVGSVMAYWTEKPGVGVNIVDKLLNYTILTPRSVLEWVFVENLANGEILTRTHIYEMVANTVDKVTNRIRQIVHARNQHDLLPDQVGILSETLDKERGQLRQLFEIVEDALRRVAEGNANAMVDSIGQEMEAVELVRGWGRRWLRVFRRKMTIEEAWVMEMLLDSTHGQVERAEGENGNAAEKRDDARDKFS